MIKILFNLTRFRNIFICVHTGICVSDSRWIKLSKASWLNKQRTRRNSVYYCVYTLSFLNFIDTWLNYIVSSFWNYFDDQFGQKLQRLTRKTVYFFTIYMNFPMNFHKWNLFISQTKSESSVFFLLIILHHYRDMRSNLNGDEIWPLISIKLKPAYLSIKRHTTTTLYYVSLHYILHSVYYILYRLTRTST